MGTSVYTTAPGLAQRIDLTEPFNDTLSALSRAARDHEQVIVGHLDDDTRVAVYTRTIVAVTERAD